MTPPQTRDAVAWQPKGFHTHHNHGKRSWSRLAGETSVRQKPMDGRIRNIDHPRPSREIIMATPVGR